MMMTIREVADRLDRAGIPMDSITSPWGDHLLIRVDQPDGRIDREATDRLTGDVIGVLGIGGFRMACGSWQLRPGFVAPKSLALA
jgi:hypothetical protein